MERDQDLLALGREVRRLRQANGFSQEELADLSGLHRNYIGGIERGERNVGVKALYQLARALNAEAGRLLTPPSNRAASSEIDDPSGSPPSRG